MGFCRRCGEIVPAQSARCRCGGSAVAPTVNWNQSALKDGGSPDRWAKTYVSTKTDKQYKPASSNETQPPRPQGRTEQFVELNQNLPRPARRFPRPISAMGPSLSLTDSKVSDHIAFTTTQRTPSPTKSNIALSLKYSPADVITSPDNASLTKAYGSLLQRSDTLPIHTCARCSQIFSPDATIYPDPQVPSGGAPRFLCRPCFVAHGGSKGNCTGCGRTVLTATNEGGFIESTGRVWHRRCFRCETCYKDMGHAPMVDLHGKPSCSECFDSCSNNRRSTPQKKPAESPNNMGGLRGSSRESSPALAELSERLGIARQLSPGTNRGSSREASSSPSPMRVLPGNSEDYSLYIRSPLLGSLHSGTPPLQAEISEISRNSSPSIRSMTTSSVVDFATPDLSSPSCSDSFSSCALSTPPSSPRQSLSPKSRDSVTPKAKGALKITTSEAKCGRCSQLLFSNSGDAQIVTVPTESMSGAATSYHASCFRCFVCGDIFEGKDQDHAMFVKDSRGVCHPECIMADNLNQPIRQHSPPFTVLTPESIPEETSKSAPPLLRTFPRFGSCESCPGCRKPVSLMEYGVVPGPQNSRWHVSCLVCGGKGAKSPRPGCGKKLDSAAKMDHSGGVWCRECMLLLPPGTCISPHGSPTRGGLIPSYTGTGFDRSRPDAGRLFGQVTGSSGARVPDMLTKQYTGGAVGIMRRGSVSPTRQMTRSVSPTKGLMPVTRHPRPVGSWKHRSIDEGRGMFLVRQMTGNGQLDLEFESIDNRV